MESEEDIGAKFVATYYRLLFRAPSSLRKLYDLHALIHREPPIQKIHICFAQTNFHLNPFIDSDVIRILSYNSYFVGENLIVSVYGSVYRNISERMFTQQFILKKVDSKFFIINDIFFIFGNHGDNNSFTKENHTPVSIPVQQINPTNPPYGFSPPSMMNTVSPPTSQQYYPIPQQIPLQPKTITPPSVLPSNMRTRVNDMDPYRSITIKGLSNSYNGNQVAQAYSKFGKVTNQNFKPNTVYLEFETVDEADNAAQSPIPSSIPQYIHVTVDKGIHTPKNYNSYRK